MALQKQKREQDLKEQREAERNSPAKKKSSSATSLLCAKKSNKRKRHNSPFKKGKLFFVITLFYLNKVPNKRLVGSFRLWNFFQFVRLLLRVVRIVFGFYKGGN